MLHEHIWVLNGCLNCHVPILIFSGWSLHTLRNEGSFVAERDDPSLPPLDAGYDDVEDVISGASI